jgi:hypothetical protein
MTRYILSTATLVAFLASGHSLTPAPRPQRIERADTSGLAATAAAPVHLLSIDGRFIGLCLERRSPELLDVALQCESPLPAAAIHVWTGPKNAWGSVVSRARPEAGLPGFYRATVAATATADRLWIGLERPGRRQAIVGHGLTGVG